MRKEEDHHKDDKKETFRTPPLAQQPHFVYQPQQYYYYYQTPVYQGAMASPPHNTPVYNPDMNLMSPPQFNYSPASPSRYSPNKQPQNYYPYGYQHSPKGKYNDSYSPKKHNKNNQGWSASPKKQGMNKNQKLKPAYPNSPIKHNRGMKSTDNKQSRMTPLTSNTNIKKDFVIQKMDDYDDYKKEMDSFSLIAQKGNNVTKINTLNCLEKNCLHLLKKPVYDILYELDMDKIISFDGEKQSDNIVEMDNDFDDLILQEITNIDNKQLDDFFTHLGESLQKSNEENDISVLDSSDTGINTSTSSGRMIVLKKSTNFFVSSKGQDPNASINAGRRISYSSKSGSTASLNNVASNKTRELRRTLNLGTSNANKETAKTTSLFGDIGDSSFVKSSKSNNFNKLIETSPKKLAMNQKNSNEESPTKKSRSLMSKGATVLKPDADVSLEMFDYSGYSRNGLGLMRQPSIVDYTEKETRSDKSGVQGNTSVLDLSFDGKAMNKSDLFKLIDSFEM